MTASPTSLISSPPASPYKGHIDWIASGFISGWVYSPDDPNANVSFKVLLDDEEMLRITADLYREDLERVGFGNGEHGYCCPHQLSENILAGKTLQLADLDNKSIGKSFLVPAVKGSTITVRKMHIEHYSFFFSIEATEDENVILQLFNNSTLFWQGTKALEKGLNRVELPVCAEIIEGKNHPITLGRLGKVDALWQQSVTVPVNELAGQRSVATRNTENRPVIAMIDRSLPKPDQDAGSYAAITEISLLQSLGYHIVFIPDDCLDSPKYTSQLHALGVEVLFSPFFFSSSVALNFILPSVCAVYITRYQNVEKHIKAIRTFSAHMPIIFNNADLHFLREIRQANVLASEDLLQKARKTRDREVKVMEQVDAILTYSEYEQAVITSHIFRSDIIHKCPWVVEVPNTLPDFDERYGIAFLGGYEHSANIDAVVFFIEQVMPILRAEGQPISVYIYGSNMPEAFKKYSSDDIFIEGYVESIDDVYLKHRVFIAPLFFGAGVKGKVLSAAAYGLPCVLSPIAIESTGLAHSVSALVAETPQQWADYVKRLYFDEKEWGVIAGNGTTVAKTLYSFTKAKSMMESILNSVGLTNGISGFGNSVRHESVGLSSELNEQASNSLQAAIENIALLSARVGVIEQILTKHFADK